MNKNVKIRVCIIISLILFTGIIPVTPASTKAIENDPFIEMYDSNTLVMDSLRLERADIEMRAAHAIEYGDVLRLINDIKIRSSRDNVYNLSKAEINRLENDQDALIDFLEKQKQEDLNDRYQQDRFILKHSNLVVEYS